MLPQLIFFFSVMLATQLYVWKCWSRLKYLQKMDGLPLPVMNPTDFADPWLYLQRHHEVENLDLIEIFAGWIANNSFY